MGNVLILVSVSSIIKMRSYEYIFIGNLAFSDMYVTLIADPMNIVSKLEGERFFHSYPRLCPAIAYLCTISCINSLGSITLMSFSRYIFTCHSKYYNNIFSKRSCIAMCFGLYLIGILLVLLNLAGIGDHSFDRKSLECIWDRMATYYYTVIFSIVLVWIPVMLTGFFYLRIYCKFRKSSKQVMDLTSYDQQRKSMCFARTLFLIYLVFATCWVPYALIIVMDRQDTFPHEAHLIITTFAHLHPSINWLVYYMTNKNFKYAFNSMMKFDICKKENIKRIQVQPAPE
ncbi:melatonin receptor type 1B-B-like [Saccostrea echinata]|uniref:melatonin receptor type 1B-B-like n=1 Tax=Saccostrea echinata TaxID=191078 RepID=UPI002A7F3FE4|nr:melatonin receptor type 1B-B-like [Saccostrea echinata]